MLLRKSRDQYICLFSVLKVNPAKKAMKRVILKILLFILPLGILIYLIPVDRRINFVMLKEDCAYRGTWIFDRIHKNDRPADVVFFGSSKTINGISDEFIESQLNLSSIHVVNFGYCRYGVNIYPVLLKEILKSKNPRLLFLEVRSDENWYSHPVFPYLANARDVFLATPFFNRDLVRDYFDSFLYRIKLIKAGYFNKDTIEPIRGDNYGFRSSTDTASKPLMENAKKEHSVPPRELGYYGKLLYMTYPAYYLEQLSELCMKHKIKLVFLYFPDYGTLLKEPMQMMTYRKYGEVLIPPQEIFNDPDNWGDENHLNQAGARKFSDWLASQVRKELGPAILSTQK